jgi:lysozyme
MRLDPQREILKAHLREAEGFRSLPYRDTVGVLTIGYGRNLDHVGITRAEAEVLLENDVDTAILACVKAFPWFVELDPVRARVVANMMFNMGPKTLSGFKRTLDAIARKDYENAAIYMLQSKWASQVGNRAVRLAKDMKTGEKKS